MAGDMQQLAQEAQTLTEQKKFVEAAQKYDEILKLNANIAEVHLNKGVVLSNAGQNEEALKAFEEAGRLKPELVGAHQNAATMLKKLGRNKEAAEVYRATLKLDPTLESAWISLAHSLNAEDQYDEALQVVEEGLKALKTPVVALHNARIFALLKLGRTDDAVNDVETVLELEPMESHSDDQRELYCIILAQKGSHLLSAGDPENAYPYLERACEGESSGATLFPFAVCLVQLHRDEEAIPLLNRAMDADPDNWKIPTILGTVFMREKKFEEAIEMFERAMKYPEAKNDSAINFNYAVALMNIGRDMDAQASLELVVSQEPENYVALGLLGTLYLQAKDYESAVETLERAAENPAAEKDSSVFYNLGYAKLMADKPEEALENFETALKINPKSEQAASAVKALKPEQMEKRMSTRDLEKAVKAHQSKGANPLLSEEDMVREAKKAKSPLDRVKAMLSPERPEYLRRKSMEGIMSGYVSALAEVYDEMTLENLKPSY